MCDPPRPLGTQFLATTWDQVHSHRGAGSQPLVSACGGSDDSDATVAISDGSHTTHTSDEQSQPGRVNEALAEVVEAFVEDHPVPVYVQGEVADVLKSRGHADVTSIDPASLDAVVPELDEPARFVGVAAPCGGWGTPRTATTPTNLADTTTSAIRPTR